MANFTVSRPGQANLTGDALALFQKIFTGEVMTAFNNTITTKGRFMERGIQNGKSASFAAVGVADAFYHTPGNEILGGQIRHGEKIITIDQLLVSPFAIANIDEAMNHFDVRGHYTKAVGEKLAQVWDKHVLQVAVLAARTATGVISDFAGGSVITEAVADDFLDATKLVDAIFLAGQRLDEKNIPETGRVAFVKPAAYNRLLRSGIIDRDIGGVGSVSTGKLGEIGGMSIVKTNQLPTANVVAGTVAAGSNDGYVGDFTRVEAVVAHEYALGTVKLLDLAIETEYSVRHQATIGIAKYAVGHGVLRPEAAVELRRAS